MDRLLKAIMLAGTLRPSPLRRELDVHVLCLPLGSQGTLLDAWLASLGTLPGLDELTIVVNTEEDVKTIERETSRHGAAVRGRISVHTTVEPAAWRGVGGILRDVADNVGDNAVIIAAEAHALPPTTLTPLASALTAPEGRAVDGAVGVCGNNEPAGVYAFTGRALGLTPEVGYFDVKEQLLPAMNQADMRSRMARLEGPPLRLRDRRGYLAAVRASLGENGAGTACHRVSQLTSIAPNAVIEGACIIEPGVMIMSDAIIHDSVLLKGATVGRGAVISRSIVGPLGAIPADERAIRVVATEPGTAAGRRETIAAESRAVEAA